MNLLEAIGVGETWQVELRFPTHEALSEFRSHCNDAGLPISLTHVYRPDESDPTIHHGLTERQHETLVRTVEVSYFDVPRQTSAKVLGADFCVSNQAITERVRRCCKTLITNTLTIPDPD